MRNSQRKLFQYSSLIGTDRHTVLVSKETKNKLVRVFLFLWTEAVCETRLKLGKEQGQRKCLTGKLLEKELWILRT